MLTWDPELAERHPEWLVVHQPGEKSRPKPEEVSEAQKAFMNTLKPDGPRAEARAPVEPAKPPAEDKGYRPYLWQFCICQEGFLNGELDLIRDLVSQYELDGVWLDGGSSPPCYCDACVRQLREQGLDPFDAGVQYQHKATSASPFVFAVINSTTSLSVALRTGAALAWQRVPLADYCPKRSCSPMRRIMATIIPDGHPLRPVTRSSMAVR
jgi:hypothetical protein